jgi:hypothetical protein
MLCAGPVRPGGKGMLKTWFALGKHLFTFAPNKTLTQMKRQLTTSPAQKRRTDEVFSTLQASHQRWMEACVSERFTREDETSA